MLRGRAEPLQADPTVGCDESHTAEVSSSELAGVATDEPEQRVVRQFVEALLFERLVDFKNRARRTNDPSRHDVIYDQVIDFQLGGDHYRCLAAHKSFGRVRVAQGSVARVVEGCTVDARLIEMISALDVPPLSRDRLRDELSQTLELCRWNRTHLAHHRASRRTLDFQALESAIVEGHPYHPSFKTRTGFSLQDHVDYGPEAGNTFQLHFLAVRKPLLTRAVPVPDAAFWNAELGATAFASLRGRLEQRGGDWRDYALVPIHPWQLRSICARALEASIAVGDIVSLGTAGDLYRATQSLRTLVNVSHPEKANVKLPLDIVCTSSRRNLRPHFVCTAPTLSKWLVSLVAEDPFLQARKHLDLLSEYAGFFYEQSSDEGEATAAQGLIGAIYRESVVGRLAPGEGAVPFTALTVVESDGRPFIADWVDVHGIELWIDRLLEVVLIPIWHMLVHHGIAFEAHPQNLVLVHRGGWPERIVLRDFHEATEFVPDYLGRPELAPDFSRVDPFFATIPDNEGYVMASTEALRQLFMDTVYVFNLADVAFLAERFFGFPEPRFWNLVQRNLRAYAESGVTEPSRIAQVACDEPEIIVESLLTKTIHHGGVLDYFEHTIKNSLVE